MCVCVCVCLAEEEEDVLALAGMRQTAAGQYLRGTRWMVQTGHSIFIQTELPTQHT